MPDIIETKKENNFYVPMGSFFQFMAESSALEENAKLVVPLKTQTETDEKKEGKKTD